MIRKLSIGVIIVLGLVIGYNLVAQITSALTSEERLSAQAEAVYKLEAQNKQLQAQLKKVTSPEFVETQARNKLGMGKPGETVVIIPEERLKQIMGTSQSAVPRLPNWQGWLKVFFH